MSAIDFLKLTQEEQVKKEQIYRYWNLNKDPANPSLLHNILTKYDTDLLLKLAISDPQFDLLCKLPVFEAHWVELWRQCGINPREEARTNHQPVQEYVPMATVPSCFDLLKGYYLYTIYRNLVDDEQKLTKEQRKDAQELLQASADCGCFFAINALCKNGLLSLRHQFSMDILLIILQYAQKAANFYLSPGYLLLGTVYQELISYQNKIAFNSYKFAEMAFEAYEVAKKLESLSQPMFTNAYQGKTLYEASNGAFSTLFEAQLRLQKHLNLDAHAIARTTENAKKIAKQTSNFFSQAGAITEPAAADAAAYLNQRIK